MSGIEEIFKLNFSAISYLESQLKTASLPELINKFAEQNYSAQDIVFVLEAGFYGANRRHINLNEMVVDGGVKAAAVAAICLLKLAFEGVENGA